MRGENKPVDEVTFLAESESDTDRLAKVLAERLPPSAVIGLVGTLGAGKTRFVRGLAAACGVPMEEVASPTFVLCQEYHGKRTIYHLDAYRITGRNEFLELGVEELFESDSLVVVEWADRAAGWLPEDRLTIEIEVTGEESREFRLTAAGGRFAPLLEAVRRGQDERGD